MPSADSSQEPLDNLTVPKRNWRTIVDALSVKNFRWYWFGSLASYFATQMYLPTQLWLTYQLTHSPLMLGLIAAAQGIPMLTLSFFSGTIIDRVNKKHIIVITQVITAITTLVIAVLLTTGLIKYWHLLVSSFINGVNQSFNMPARNAIVAELVPREKMYNAFALNNGGMNLARIAGPALAGMIIGFIGPQAAYFLGVGFNIIAIIALSYLPLVFRTKTISGSFLQNFRAGLLYLRTQKVIIFLLVMEIALTLFVMSHVGLMPVFAELLSLGPEGYGFLISASGIGSLAGAIWIASLGDFKKKGVLLICTGILVGFSLALFANARNIADILGIGNYSLYLAMFFLMVIGVAGTGYTATSLTIVQMSITDEYRGRITSIYQMVVSLLPFSILLASAIAEKAGAPITITIGSMVFTIFIMIIAISKPSVRKLS